MKVSRAQSARNRQAVLEAAARLYRERGVGGVGVAEISREAGFTHGGFYGRFESKEALAAEASAHALELSLARLRDSLDKHGGDAAPYFQNYLRPQHRDGAGQGCAIAALAVDAARSGGALGEALTKGIAGYLSALAGQDPDGDAAAAPPSKADKERAILSLSALIGGLVLARATAQAAPALSDEILALLPERLAQLWRQTQ